MWMHSKIERYHQFLISQILLKGIALSSLIASGNRMNSLFLIVLGPHLKESEK